MRQIDFERRIRISPTTGERTTKNIDPKYFFGLPSVQSLLNWRAALPAGKKKSLVKSDTDVGENTSGVSVAEDQVVVDSAADVRMKIEALASEEPDAPLRQSRMAVSEGDLRVFCSGSEIDEAPSTRAVSEADLFASGRRKRRKSTRDRNPTLDRWKSAVNWDRVREVAELERSLTRLNNKLETLVPITSLMNYAEFIRHPHLAVDLSNLERYVPPESNRLLKEQIRYTYENIQAESMGAEKRRLMKRHGVRGRRMAAEIMEREQQEFCTSNQLQGHQSRLGPIVIPKALPRTHRHLPTLGEDMEDERVEVTIGNVVATRRSSGKNPLQLRVSEATSDVWKQFKTVNQHWHVVASASKIYEHFACVLITSSYSHFERSVPRANTLFCGYKTLRG